MDGSHVEGERKSSICSCEEMWPIGPLSHIKSVGAVIDSGNKSFQKWNRSGPFESENSQSLLGSVM
ncbi:MAG: hypothetical protein Aurels2KO_50400 [Aureliella sp.]